MPKPTIHAISLGIALPSIIFFSSLSQAACENKINGCCYKTDDTLTRFSVTLEEDEKSACVDKRAAWASNRAKMPITFYLGDKGLPYYGIGADIEELMGCSCMTFDKKTGTDGSSDTIDTIISSVDAKFGIAQADMLAYRMKPKKENEYLNKIRVVGQLFPEYVHVIVRQEDGIDKWEDLAGKKVHIGARKSGTRFTVRMLLGDENLIGTEMAKKHAGKLLWNLIPERIVDGDAINSLKAGTVDAIFQVSGAPAERIANSLLEANTEFKIIAIPELHHLPTGSYDRVVISSDAYLGNSSPIETYSTSAMLITFNWPRDHAWCAIGAEIRSTVESSLDELKKIVKNRGQGQSPDASINWLEIDSLIKPESDIELPLLDCKNELY